MANDILCYVAKRDREINGNASKITDMCADKKPQLIDKKEKHRC